MIFDFVRFLALTCAIGLGLGLVSYWWLELKRRFLFSCSNFFSFK